MSHRLFYKHTISIKVAKIFQSDKHIYKISLSSNNLKINNELFFIMDCSSNWQIINELEVEDLLDVFDLELSLDVHIGKTEMFINLYEDTEMTDFELRGKDGSVSMHRMILAAHSPVMKTMLSGTWKEVATGAVKLPNTSKETLQQLKDFIYLQKLPEIGIEQLFKLAAYYMMTDLVNYCAVKLLRNLTAGNITEFLEFAVKYKVKLMMLAIWASVKSDQVTLEDIDNELICRSALLAICHK